jgi:hypothetical protein
MIINSLLSECMTAHEPCYESKLPFFFNEITKCMFIYFVLIIK